MVSEHTLSTIQSRSKYSDLEEPLQPPDLEHHFTHEYAKLEQAPPFHSGVGAFGRVAMYAFADDDIRLLIFYLLNLLG